LTDKCKFILGRLLFDAYRGFQSHRNGTKRGTAARTAVLLILRVSASGGVNALAKDNSLTFERDCRTIVFEPYAPLNGHRNTAQRLAAVRSWHLWGLGECIGDDALIEVNVPDDEAFRIVRCQEARL
jgi:hypothetical protein